MCKVNHTFYDHVTSFLLSTETFLSLLLLLVLTESERTKRRRPDKEQDCRCYELVHMSANEKKNFYYLIILSLTYFPLDARVNFCEAIGTRLKRVCKTLWLIIWKLIQCFYLISIGRQRARENTRKKRHNIDTFRKSNWIFFPRRHRRRRLWEM